MQDHGECQRRVRAVAVHRGQRGAVEGGMEREAREPQEQPPAVDATAYVPGNAFEHDGDEQARYEAAQHEQVLLLDG